MTETYTHIAGRQISPNEQTEYQALPGVSFQAAEDDTLVIKDQILNLVEHTTDRVKLLSNQSFIWLGRSDWTINSGGVKIQPEQIERQLAAFIAVPFFIHGKPDEKLGQQVVLFVEDDTRSYGAELWDKAQLHRYHHPARVIHCSGFVRTATGKINRLATVAKYA
jgi:O-succinylbenzoic acid--CoA ligase